jgi:inorganic pyrophosphatase
MNLDRVTSGRSLPDDFNVIIEFPMNADPIKYAVDKDTGALFVDRLMMTAMHYPWNCGYIPHTLSDDGDPVDALVITPVPVTVVGWGGPEEARAEIMTGVARYQQARPQPKF